MSDSVFQPTEIKDDLDRLEKAMKRLSVEYEMYLTQQVRYEPFQRRAECDAIIRHYQKNLPRRTTDRFRLNTLVHRYRTSMERWSRRKRLLEETGSSFLWQRQGQGQQERPAQAALDVSKPRQLMSTKLGSAAAKGEQLRDLYHAYRDARRSRGHAVSKMRYRTFATRMEKALTEARARHGGDVELRLDELDGKVRISVRPARTRRS